MYVINNFSNQHYAKLSEVDLLAWLMSLINYKILGYKTKLYCFPEDIEFLAKTPILNYYDEIDKETLVNDKSKTLINEEHFWFWRKIVAIENEYKLGHEFFYSDTDVVIMEKPDFSDCDLYVWWFEDRDPENWTRLPSVYIDWDRLSKPKHYKMPEYIKNTGRDNYNCGVLWFKEESIFKKWKEEMLAFMVDNPCEIYGEIPEFKPAIWACNAEQRILKGVANYLNLKVKAFDEAIYTCGVTPKGIHLYYWKYSWRCLKQALEKSGNWWSMPERLPIIQSILAMSDIVNLWMSQLKEAEHYVEWTNFANQEYIYQLLELNKNLIYLATNYD